jgi:hypothetical protein
MTGSAPTGTSRQIRLREIHAEQLRLLLRCWMEWKSTDPGQAKSAQAWDQQLDEASVFWKVCGASLPGLLAERFDAVARLSERAAEQLPLAAPEPLRDWIDQARQIAVHWPPCHPGDWEALVVGLARQQNRLADAIVTQSLAAALRQHRMPKPLTSPLLPLLQPSLQWLSALMLPPAPSCRLSPDAYVFTSSATVGAQQVEATTWAILDEWASAERSISQVLPPTGDRSVLDQLGGLVKELMHRREQLLALLNRGREGWPLEAETLRAAGEKLLAVLNQMMSVSHPLLRNLAGQAGSWAGQLQEQIALLWRETLQRSPQATSPSLVLPAENAESSVPPPSRHIGPASARVGGTSGGTSQMPLPLAANSQPDADSAWHVRLDGAAQQLEQAAQDEVAASLGPRLRKLAETWQLLGDQREQSARRTDAVRELVTCLVFLDQLVQSMHRPRWARSVRQRLRDILEEEGSYRILDTQLIGLALSDCEDQAVAVGVIESNRIKSGRIAEIRQPGYALVSSGNTLNVLRKATVVLAR